MRPRRLAALAGLLLVPALWFGGLQWTGNLHTVIPGQLYRSATLSPTALDALVQREGIRTIINLRGPHKGTGWYDDETRVAAADGVSMVDLSWSAGRELTDDMVARFFEAAGAAQKPILIHCMSGSDRTGLAVALYVAKFDKASEADAEEQLSIRYGHLSIPLLSRAWAMDETFERLEPSLGYFGS